MNISTNIRILSLGMEIIEIVIINMFLFCKSLFIREREGEHLGGGAEGVRKSQAGSGCQCRARRSA